MNRKFLHNLIRSFTRIDMIVMVLLCLVILWLNVYAGIFALILVASISLIHARLMDRAAEEGIKEYEESVIREDGTITDEAAAAEINRLKKLNEDSQSCIALINIDNYDELLSSSPAEEQSTISAEIDKKIRSWTQYVDAAVTRVRSNRYYAQFEQKYVDPLRVDFWLGEGIVGREVIAEDNLLGKDIGIEIPGHDYYRSLALSLYSATGRRPEEKFPSASDISNILGKGVERCWAFSHLLMPDVDEEVSFNTQRVLYYINKMREIGMNGVVMGNVRYSNYADLYAYGRFANDSEATVDEVLREYAGFLATEETADDLAEIFKYLNNYDSNQPVCADDLKLPDLKTRIKSVDEAIEMLRNVKLSDDRHFMLVEPAISYYLKIMARLMEIKADTRPEDAEDRAISLVTFDQNNGGTISVESPALNGKAGKLTIRVGEYNLAQGTIDAVDALDFARYGYVHYDVYVDEDVTTRSYVLLGSDTENVGLDRFWQYDFGGSINLKAGWNHISVKISKGIYCGKNEIDWEKITDYRILFWNDTEEPLTVYLDNFYISNYAENRHP